MMVWEDRQHGKEALFATHSNLRFLKKLSTESYEEPQSPASVDLKADIEESDEL